uniref:Uncharacterized protein n=1 Tax=Enterobacter cloacae TaxID=550 RepID=A0A4P8GP31_ENTCL|nr:hypothetical protein [Enterobacter cloacae]
MPESVLIVWKHDTLLKYMPEILFIQNNNVKS